MMDKNYQPAFPVDIRLQKQGEEMQWYFGPGLSKREYLAAMAMQAIISTGGVGPGVAKEAIRHAENLLAELEK